MILLTSGVSSNSFDITFDDVNILDGLRQLAEYFKNLPNHLPGFQRVGSILGLMLNSFPPKFWFCMIICVICLTLARILRRF